MWQGCLHVFLFVDPTKGGFFFLWVEPAKGAVVSLVGLAIGAFRSSGSKPGVKARSVKAAEAGGDKPGIDVGAKAAVEAAESAGAAEAKGLVHIALCEVLKPFGASLARAGEILAPFGELPTSRDRVRYAAQNVSVREVLAGLRKLLPRLREVLPRLAGLLPSLAEVLPRLVKFRGGSVIANSTHGEVLSLGSNLRRRCGDASKSLAAFCLSGETSSVRPVTRNGGLRIFAMRL